MSEQPKPPKGYFTPPPSGYVEFSRGGAYDKTEQRLVGALMVAFTLLMAAVAFVT